MGSRSTTWFRRLGAGLAATWIADVVSTAVADPADHRWVVRLGTAGILAIVLAWAAASRSYVVALARTGIAAFGLLVVDVVAEVVAFSAHGYGIEVWDPLLGGGRTRGAFQPVSEYALVLPSVRSVVVIIALIGMFGAVARGAVVARSRIVRFISTALLAVLFTGTFAGHLSDGAVVASLISALAAGWLWWALRKARGLRLAETLQVSG
ncbi:MAG: hypothetical protein REI11_18175 [Patulibacter sp.]|nr:hypothetical protein [Patulibacter sp.]